jgi:hypothetical protein
LYVVYRTWRIEEGKIEKIVREVRKEGRKEIRNVCEGRNVCKEVPIESKKERKWKSKSNRVIQHHSKRVRVRVVTKGSSTVTSLHSYSSLSRSEYSTFHGCFPPVDGGVDKGRCGFIFGTGAHVLKGDGNTHHVQFRRGVEGHYNATKHAVLLTKVFYYLGTN